MRVPSLRLCIYAIAFAAVSAGRSDAQQTIFNVPTADVLDKGRVYAELDFSFKPNCQEAVCRFSSLVPRVVVGTGTNFEIGLNVLGNIQPGADATTLVPSMKWRFYQNEKNGWALYGGNHFYIPVRNRAYNFGSHTYVAAAKTINKTRLTAGAWVSSRNVFAPNAVRGGAMFGLEQTVNKYLNINADWYTGKHAAGYFTPGVAIKAHSKVTIYAGYSIGNADATRGNHFFLVELGYTL
jgi:hypothetical protein